MFPTQIPIGAEAVVNLGDLKGTATMTAQAGGVLAYGTSIGNTTWSLASIAPPGVVASITLELTNGGAYTQTWGSSVKWDAATAPTLTSSGLDILEFYTRDGGVTWRGFLAAKGVA